jgi:hypothetical protein
MSLALRCFSKCITSSAGFQNIVWVFSGTRPTLLTEITLTSGLLTVDISYLMQDFSSAAVKIIFENYFNLDGITEEESLHISSVCDRLSGPPKIVFFFLTAASRYSFRDIADFILKASEIEAAALELFRTKIQSTFKGDLASTARNLCLLYTTAIISPNATGFIEVDKLSRHFLFLNEAGPLRVHDKHHNWKILAPNRFLIQIFREYVHWFTWNNVELLKNIIKASAATYTLNGKVFEFLFALELCNSPDSSLWTFIHQHCGIHPVSSWKPSIVLTKHISHCNDVQTIYIMQDPDRGNSKTDVIFFASTSTHKLVRVLVQFTVANCPVKKVSDSIESMRSLQPCIVNNETLLDHRMFIGPNSDAVWIDSASDDNDDRYYVFLKPSSISKQFEFPIEIMCDSSGTNGAIEFLIKKAERAGDFELAHNIAGDFRALPLKKLSKQLRIEAYITDLAGFYWALRSEEDLDDDEINVIEVVFNKENIKFKTLPRLTDAKLTEYGIRQRSNIGSH